MQDKPDPNAREAKVASTDSKRDRLKRALRDNLKRRKMQSKGRSGFPTARDGEEPPGEEN